MMRRIFSALLFCAFSLIATPSCRGDEIIIEWRTPGELLAKSVGVGLGQALSGAANVYRSAQETSQRTDAARRQFDSCGGCPEARQALDQARAAESLQRNAMQRLAEVSRRLTGSRLGAVGVTLMGQTSAELRELKAARQLISDFCIATVGLERNWRQVSVCQSQISAQGLVDLQHSQLRDCRIAADRAAEQQWPGLDRPQGQLTADQLKRLNDI
jgi:hypothetical protein